MKMRGGSFFAVAVMSRTLQSSVEVWADPYYSGVSSILFRGRGFRTVLNPRTFRGS